MNYERQLVQLENKIIRLLDWSSDLERQRALDHLIQEIQENRIVRSKEYIRDAELPYGEFNKYDRIQTFREREDY